ncbi:hypothetical protein LEP1GSC050_4065 [Leptospira broomii serovar Hurstbridge str. 5399]|uniref:Uncharacterized protein n=1 Tax=Leptospira broomii serovar Hurstbridge str. 5399 TaxID=1049789 RepID=T0F098_9LEPT|nr:hypothetical protein LEP1GSC050_4065 [Leptospira broomii serovar Hurstbridge str. 5399]
MHFLSHFLQGILPVKVKTMPPGTETNMDGCSAERIPYSIF